MSHLPRRSLSGPGGRRTFLLLTALAGPLLTVAVGCAARGGGPGAASARPMTMPPGWRS